MDHHVETQSDKNGQGTKEFIPPRHWIDIEELSSTYWSNPKTIEKRGQEFHDKPIETIAMIERADAEGIARRDFLTIMGASMAMASFACARRPVHKIIPHVIRPEEILPGVANYYASTNPDSGYGVLVKTREGRPIKLEGNPDHPINGGALDVRGQAALLSLYDPDRLKDPITHTKGGGSSRKLAWTEVDAAITAKLKSASRVRILTGTTMGDSGHRLTREFLGAFSNGAHVQYDVLGSGDIALAQSESYGTPVVPTYHFDRAEVIVTLGADFLASWGSSVEHQRGFTARRKLDKAAPSGSKAMSKLIAFESVFSNTGANADERYAIRPGDELKIALAIAHELIVNQKKTRYAADLGIVSSLGGYTPKAVAEELGLSGGETTLRKVATTLWDARGKGLVVAGGLQSQTKDAVALQIAVNLLNSALENEGATVDGTVNPDVRPMADYGQMAKLIAEMQSGAVEVLIIHGVNPAYTLPKSAGFEDAVKKVPLVVVISDRDDETARLADFVLPDHHWLENWGDAQPRKHVYSLIQPTVAPLFNSRSYGDSLLAWVRGAGLKASGLAVKVASASDKDGNTWHDYVKANWRETVYKSFGKGAPFEKFWEQSLRDGVINGAKGMSGGSPRAFRVASLSKLPRYRVSPGGMMLALYANGALHDGSMANNPWLQEFPDPITSVTWDNFVSVSPATAQAMGFQNHDVISIKTDQGTVEAPVRVQAGMHNHAVAIAVGYGRRAVGKVGDGVGTDVYPLTLIDGGRQVFTGFPVTLSKTGKIYQLAETQWHFASENRPVLNDITLAEYEKNPKAANETDPELRPEHVDSIWPSYKYSKPYRWGMSIDTNACTGCGACTIACQAENNIPVVGRDNVRVSRQMHWIRIDRYYSGTPESPSVVFQPMLCQHCENAPCETVCPVLATVHDDEGTNNMVYNRCVGTRYCQNNCPYKVRRFNFFDHWKSYEGTMNLAWNPEVTVRTRGVMEKCSFCIQRIKDAKFEAVKRGDSVKDGEIKTACQQTCPSDAIVFGNINDPNSRVSQLMQTPRTFRVLETLNTKPSVSYLTKVRNVEATQHEGAHHEHT